MRKIETIIPKLDIPVRLCITVRMSQQKKTGPLLPNHQANHQESWVLSSADLETLLESSDDAIFSKDLNNIITQWSRGAEKVYGYTHAEMVGQSVTRLVAPGSPWRSRADFGADQMRGTAGTLGNEASDQRRLPCVGSADRVAAAGSFRSDHRGADGSPRHHKPPPNRRDRPASGSAGSKPCAGYGNGQPDRPEYSGPSHRGRGAAPYRRRRAHPGWTQSMRPSE